MNEYIEALKYYACQNPPDYTSDANSILELLYCYYRERNTIEPDAIKAAFEDSYQRMRGMPLMEKDRIVDAVCTRCRGFIRDGFVDGIKIGVCLEQEIEPENQNPSIT